MADQGDLESEPTRRREEGGNVALQSGSEVDRSLIALIRQALEPSGLSSHIDGSIDEGVSVSRIGKFEVIGVIGRGGFGTVLLAHDPDLGRERALKVPNPETLSSPGALSRFLAEARLASRVDHPNVVRVYEAATLGPFPYIVMEYCPGGSLGQWLAERSKQEPLPQRWVAALVSEIAEGVHQAHLAGLLHRDIKPANVLLERIQRDGDHDVPVFRPKIADFGLAKVFEEDAIGRSMTASGTPVGTWAYMSPEQARGDKDIRATTDVYAIGTILYELLTGERLYANLTQPEILGRLTGSDTAPSPRAIWKDLHRDLETICLKCLEKAPSDRYQNSSELTNDLRRYLDGLPILARPAPLWKRGVSRVKRYPVRSTLAVIGLLFILMGLGAVTKIRNDRAQVLIRDLFEARIEELPKIIAELDRYQWEVLPSIKEVNRREPIGSARSARAALALLRNDETLAGNLCRRIVVSDAREHGVIRDFLRVSQPEAARSQAQRLWRLLEDKSTDSGTRLRAACFLASFDADNPKWATHGKGVAVSLVEAGGRDLEVAEWAKLLLPVGRHIEGQLRGIMADRSYPSPSLAASWALAEILADRPAELAGLVLEADERQLGPLSAKFTDDRSAVAILKEALTLPPLTNATAPAIDQRGKRRANSAAVLARIGKGEIDWRGFLVNNDPSPRTYLIERLSAAGAPALVVLDLLMGSPPILARTFILALAEYSGQSFAPSDREEASRRLLALYQVDPDPGVHSAISWLLRRWGKDVELAAVDAELRSTSGGAEVRWCLDSEGHSLSIVPGPTTMAIFTSTDLGTYMAPAVQETTTIPYTYGIATREVTLAQFKRFLSETKVSTRRLDRNLPGGRFLDVAGNDDRGPVDRVSYYAAAHYCLWLSEREGIPRDEWCYEPVDESPLGPIRNRADYLNKTGYRIPTYEEWMCGLMFETGLIHYFAPGNEKMSLFEWLAEDSGSQVRPVGTRRPNSLGLHDMLGNLSEWCTNARSKDPIRQALVVGPSFVSSAAQAFDWRVGAIDPDTPPIRVGFRVARTMRSQVVKRAKSSGDRSLSNSVQETPVQSGGRYLTNGLGMVKLSPLLTDPIPLPE